MKKNSLENLSQIQINMNLLLGFLTIMKYLRTHFCPLEGYYASYTYLRMSTCIKGLFSVNIIFRLGAFYSPLIPGMALVTFFIFFYIKKVRI